MPRTQNFGKALYAAFQKESSTCQFREESLFNALRNSFNNMGSGKFSGAVEIIHGNRSHVSFSKKADYVDPPMDGAIVTKELADMLFIIFGNRGSQIRLMYLQNKLGKNDWYFKADLLQLNLLKERRPILSANLPFCAFGNPLVLTNAILSSVAGYGIFYRDNSNNQKTYNMSYYPADCISPRKDTGKKMRMATYFPINYDIIRNYSGHEQILGTRNLERFGDALTSMQIGTPIEHTDVMYPVIRSFLLKNSANYRNTVADNHSINLQYAHKKTPVRGASEIIIINADFFNQDNPEANYE